ncbi:MAG: DUF5615 family PIN-like protein [Gemmataceae bacterium]
MVLAILADINVEGQVQALARQMQSGSWAEIWSGLGLALKHFRDVGLSRGSSDVEIWRTCQTQNLLLVTDNRNYDSPDSMEAALRLHNTPDSLPIFTISNISKFQTVRSYAEKVLEDFFDYLLRIDEVRGSGRLYLPMKG